MRQIESRNLAQLLAQLKFTPLRKRRKQLESAEKLLSIIEEGKQYPFEFVCYKITGFRPKAEIEWESIKGDQLAGDLRIFISKLSGQIAESVSEQKEKVYTIDEVAEMCGVSTKTIDRWRKRGLAARKFVFDDGQKRLGFLQTIVDAFLKENPQLIVKAKSFKRLSDKEKQQIIGQAVSLVGKTNLSRYQIIEQIAAKTGRAHETIRYILLNYEKANPDKPIFNLPPGVMSPSSSSELYKLFKEGGEVKDLMGRFGRSKSSTYRIINRRRAKALLVEKVEFIGSHEFLEEGAEESILGTVLEIKRPVTFTSSEPFELTAGSLSKYLQTLKNIELLHRDQEVGLFRRYNYLKYLACLRRTGMKPVRASSARLKDIEDNLGQAETIKKIIIEANLRLVVSIANKHLTMGTSLQDLVSEGNFSLMRAVEKFDYTRGVRFATYASWAIAKDYARKIPAEAGRPDKAPTRSLANVQRNLRTADVAGVVAIERARGSLIQVIKDNLDEREQYIIINHFGLVGTLIRKYKKTLQQIGDDLDLSKERVRQVELMALQKLRYSLSIEEFELLTE